MRETKFRAKRSYDKKWIYGFLLNVGGSFHLIQKDDMREDDHHIMQESDIPTWVDEDTIGQFTGMKDLNSSDIYEGDLLKDLNGVVYEVWYSEDKACYMAEMKNSKNDMVDILGGYDTNDFFEVIGNIYDNKGLITKE